MGEAQVVFGAATEEQKLYVESLEERVAEYEAEAFEKLVALRETQERVRSRLVAQDWTDDQVDELLAP